MMNTEFFLLNCLMDGVILDVNMLGKIRNSVMFDQSDAPFNIRINGDCRIFLPPKFLEEILQTNCLS